MCRCEQYNIVQAPYKKSIARIIYCFSLKLDVAILTTDCDISF